DFRITPKGREGTAPLPIRLLIPYATLSLASGLPVFWFDQVERARGFLVFATANSALYAILLLVIVLMHAKENPGFLAKIKSHSRVRQAALGASLAFVLAVPIIALPLKIPHAIDALWWGHERLLNINYAQASRLSIGTYDTHSNEISNIELGIYDPVGAFSKDARISFEHVFVPWQV